MLKGSLTALITPFVMGDLDEKTFQDLVARQVAGGTHGLVPCGTTGEAPTLTKKEHTRVIALCAEAAGGLPVIAGCGTNSTEKTISYARQSEDAGANALLVVTPYYNRPSQEGLYLHFKAVAASSHLPIIIYNIPGRTGVDMTTETMARLYEDCETIVGVKDATGDLARIEEQTATMGPDFIQLSGDDILAFDFMKKGGHGCISVTANIAPDFCSEFHNLCLAGDFEKAEVLHKRLTPLHRDLFVESNPVPVKYAASKLGLCRKDVRLPLAPLSATSRKTVEAALNQAEITA